MSDLMNNIKNLRDLTGAGFLDCKKALEQNSNDVDSSIDFLRKKGLAKANKKSSREAKEGAVGIYTGKNTTAIIQINTETDFAAKNDVFLDFMDEIGNLAVKIDDDNISLDDFKNMSFDELLVIDRFTNIIAKLGENIILSDLIVIKNSEDELISNYIHNSYRKNIGKIAVVLKSKVKNNSEEAIIFGKNLCMHIAASKPLAMNIDQLDSKMIEKEKEIQLETIKASGKPDNIIEKILDGKMNKFFSESIFLRQQYILDPDKTISQSIEDFSKKNNMNIIEYKILSIGSQ